MAALCKKRGKSGHPLRKGLKRYGLTARRRKTRGASRNGLKGNREDIRKDGLRGNTEVKRLNPYRVQGRALRKKGVPLEP